ncbi:McrB family protein [Flavobacterium sp. HNIBRBA15423]|uniref:McrB family protein n=1 Tax=Flavobacterium sp. HNIBRBA15423 TaxID=3458683 RepID=UPI00404471D2
MNKDLYDFLNQKSIESPFKSSLSERGGYITFSNSGQRGSVKYFSLGLDSLINTLSDILENLNEFSSHQNYIEGEWRDLGNQYYTDGTSNAMATVQTKPLFSTLSKLIVWANNPALDDINTDQKIVLEEKLIKNTILKLDELADKFKPKEVILEKKVILKKQKLKWIIFNTFKYLLTSYDEEIITKGLKEKESKINDTIYKGFYLPIYFGTDNLFGVFENEQFKENLKSSNTERYFDENINIFKNNFSYFTTQWSDVEGTGLTLNNFNNYLREISDNQLEIIREDKLYSLIFKNNKKSPLKETEQKIYYGAPGTGKSHKVEQTLKDVDADFYERITFHPEFDNASFIGSYRPKSVDGKINYEFVPQSFTNIYVKAWNDLDNQYYLVIEEINRGNCAEIFGDIFQLLDRKSNYTVSASNELKEHLHKVLINKDGISNGLKLPPNLSIYATMNTSDQSLFPMDSAFKRRWDWEYIPICYDDVPENESFEYKVKIDETTYFKWIDFIKNVNAVIKTNQNLGMDKCIGNYFIKSDSKEIALNEFINKAIFYLWNDVFKDEDSSDSIFEKGTSYEDFFPININGRNEVIKILEALKIETIVKATI